MENGEWRMENEKKNKIDICGLKLEILHFFSSKKQVKYSEMKLSQQLKKK
jgi:hypothetical protein